MIVLRSDNANQPEEKQQINCNQLSKVQVRVKEIKSREFEEGAREQVVHARDDLARVGDEAGGCERVLVELLAEQPTELLEIRGLRRAARRRRTRLQSEQLLDERVPAEWRGEWAK